MRNRRARAERPKALRWNRAGFCIFYKHLERGLSCRVPLRLGKTSVAIDVAEFAKTLKGM